MGIGLRVCVLREFLALIEIAIQNVLKLNENLEHGLNSVIPRKKINRDLLSLVRRFFFFFFYLRHAQTLIKNECLWCI